MRLLMPSVVTVTISQETKHIVEAKKCRRPIHHVQSNGARYNIGGYHVLFMLEFDQMGLLNGCQPCPWQVVPLHSQRRSGQPSVAAASRYCPLHRDQRGPWQEEARRPSYGRAQRPSSAASGLHCPSHRDRRSSWQGEASRSPQSRDRRHSSVGFCPSYLSHRDRRRPWQE